MQPNAYMERKKWVAWRKNRQSKEERGEKQKQQESGGDLEEERMREGQRSSRQAAAWGGRRNRANRGEKGKAEGRETAAASVVCSGRPQRYCWPRTHGKVQLLRIYDI